MAATLLGGLSESTRLRLLESKALPSGDVLVNYQRVLN